MYVFFLCPRICHGRRYSVYERRSKCDLCNMNSRRSGLNGMHVYEVIPNFKQVDLKRSGWLAVCNPFTPEVSTKAEHSARKEPTGKEVLQRGTSHDQDHLQTSPFRTWLEFICSRLYGSLRTFLFGTFSRDVLLLNCQPRIFYLLDVYGPV